jgi:hypothetical protein
MVLPLAADRVRLERETINGSELAAIIGAPGPADHEPAGTPLALTMKWHRSE